MAKQYNFVSFHQLRVTLTYGVTTKSEKGQLSARCEELLSNKVGLVCITDSNVLSNLSLIPRQNKLGFIFLVFAISLNRKFIQLRNLLLIFSLSVILPLTLRFVSSSISASDKRLCMVCVLIFI